MSVKIKQFTLGSVEKNTEDQVNKFIKCAHICAQDYMFSNMKTGQSKILISYTEEEGGKKELLKLCRFSQQKAEDVERSILDYIQKEIIDNGATIKDIRKVDEERIAFEIDPSEKDTSEYDIKVCELPLDNFTCDIVLEKFFSEFELPDDYELATDLLWCGRYLIIISKKSEASDEEIIGG